ncbi:hypothetical protein PRK78_002246 [Emydomyces testavorans]|uniref:Ankyrin n=1 Tax=Emydomyces testavorans TaxID=2070801 RepID=A0AAF0DDZ8_9EURO|nr:hypothetical protein PRK78_002246 [Emydomyces testavorans]
MEDEQVSSDHSESSGWTSYFCDSFKPACFEVTWEHSLDELPLHVAVLHDDANAVRKLLESEAFAHTNGAPIHEAIRRGNLDIVDLLLKHDAYVHIRAPDGFGELSVSAITIAVELGHVLIVQALLDAGADPAVADPGTLGIAAELGHKNVIEVLLQWSRSTRVPLDKNDALENAAREWQVNATWTILEDGVNNKNALNDALISAVDSRLWARSLIVPFYVKFETAYRTRQTSVMKMLLDAGADPNHKYHPRSHWEATMIHKLHDLNSSITPLQAAASASGSADAVKLLLERKATVDLVDKFGQSPLFYATLSNDIEIVKTLLKWGANIGERNTKLYTPLHMATQFSSPPIAILLLDRGADPVAKNANGETPLHTAAHGSFELNLETMQSLLQRGADVNERTKEGWTPLIHAVECNSETRCRFLLENGADVNATTKCNETALQRAIRHGTSVPVVNVLLEYGANLVGPNQDSALHWAVESQRPEAMVQCLLDHDVDPDVRDKYGATPLINSVKTRAFRPDWAINTSLIKLLIRKGADVGAVDNQGLSEKS